MFAVAGLKRFNISSRHPTNLIIISLSKFFSIKPSSSVPANATAEPTTTKTKYSSVSSSCSSILFSRIRNHSNVVDVLDKCFDNKEVGLNPPQLRHIIQLLHSHKRFLNALQVSEWICRKAIFKFSCTDHALHLHLIGIVRGSEAAEKYFYNLGNRKNNEKIYSSLLHCYIREGLLTKARILIRSMKDEGYALSCLVYNSLMSMYKRAGQHERIPDVFSEMRSHGVCPNSFTYRMCVSSFVERCDLDGMERFLEEIIELRMDVYFDWATYSIVAYCFVKGNEKEKAVKYMKKLEEKVGEEKAPMGYNHLISLYGHLGDKDEMMRLWKLQKVVCGMQIARDYITMLGSLVKLGELEQADALITEWDLSCRSYDCRVTNILLIGYCRKGLVEKSEKLLRDIVSRGKTPTPNSWAIVAAGYLDNDDMERAFECMKEALAAKEHDMKWKPKLGQITEILQWLGDKGEIEEVEAFARSLRVVMPVNIQMYSSLIKASMRVGKDIGPVLRCMKNDKIGVDDVTLKILGLRRGVDGFELEIGL